MPKSTNRRGENHLLKFNNMPYDFIISSSVLANGKTAFNAQLANTPQPRFLIGYKTRYDGNFGLYNTSVQTSNVYNPQLFETDFGFWAYFIAPTAKAESGYSYTCLNTYDRAKFTFTFMQYAAHVPNGDFVVFFRKLLQLPMAINYFPKLQLQNNRIQYIHTNNTLTQLENDTSTQALMDYLNPSLLDVENQEAICAARMVHWATNDSEHRRIQVETAIELFTNNMKHYSRVFNLNYAPAKVCAMLCDILHQGRGNFARIGNALNTNGDWEKAYTNLGTIGNALYQQRITTVKNTIASLITQGIFNKKYDVSSNTFI